VKRETVKWLEIKSVRFKEVSCFTQKDGKNRLCNPRGRRQKRLEFARINHPPITAVVQINEAVGDGESPSVPLSSVDD
jgi:hypothetical protein